MDVSILPNHLNLVSVVYYLALYIFPHSKFSHEVCFSTIAYLAFLLGHCILPISFVGES